MKEDADDDPDDPGHHRRAARSDDALFLAMYGKKASPVDRRSITALVKRYYVAAAVGDGATACLLLSSNLTAGLSQAQGQPTPRTNTCATVVSPLLQQQHDRLAADDVSTMVVVDAHVKGNLGVAVLGFRAEPISEILLTREKGIWKVDALFDSLMT